SCALTKADDQWSQESSGQCCVQQGAPVLDGPRTGGMVLWYTMPCWSKGVQMPGFIQTVVAGVRAIPGLVLTWLLRKGREVVIGAALGALLGFFWEDVDAWVRSRVQPGNLSGTYVIASFVYPEEPGDRQ